MAGKIGHAKFVELLKERFPAVAAEIDECDEGLLHLEMSALMRATNDAIRIGDVATVKAHFAFIDEVERFATGDVSNAVGASYLEHLLVDSRDGRFMKARGMLSPRLLAALETLEAFWVEIKRRKA